MSDRSKIEWTDATWTPVKGCTRVSPGCGGPGKAGGCYAEIMAARFSKPGQWGEGLAEIVTLPDGSKDHRWTGVVRFDEAELLKPLRWRRPRRIFVCSTADLFHEKVEDEWIDRVFAIMALCPQHTFQVLTKRPERMRAYFAAEGRYRDDEGVSRERECLICDAVNRLQESWRNGPIGPLWEDSFRGHRLCGCQRGLPLPNVWLGTSTEDQQRADERIPHLLATPAAVRFVSAEPLLGPINLNRIHQVFDGGLMHSWESALNGKRFDEWGEGDIEGCPKLDWVIAGGESGPGARPMHPDWARSLRDQCAAAGVPFFFKQWGEWRPKVLGDGDHGLHRWVLPPDAPRFGPHPGECLMVRRGKKETGRLLDGVTHDGMPEVSGA